MTYETATLVHDDGISNSTFKRRTHRSYSHVVVGKGKRSGVWKSLSWCGRFDLAKRKVAEHHRSGWYSEVQIIEVNNPA